MFNKVELLISAFDTDLSVLVDIYLRFYLSDLSFSGKSDRVFVQSGHKKAGKINLLFWYQTTLKHNLEGVIVNRIIKYRPLDAPKLN